MKNNKMKKQRIVALMATLLFMGGVVQAQVHRSIKVNQLPSAARNYLRDGLGSFDVKQVDMVVDSFKTSYEVYLVGNTKVNFNRDGGWRIITTSTSLPEEAFPGEIWQYLKENYFGKPITRLQRYADGYQVTVDGKDETFDLRGNHK